MTDAYLDTLLEDQFGASSGHAFYLGLISSTGYTGVDKANDTMASHTGWSEVTAVTATRPLWSPGAATGQEITNPTPAAFLPTADGEAVGFFVTTDATTGGVGGTLVDMVLFNEPAGLYAGETFQVTWVNVARDIGN